VVLDPVVGVGDVAVEDVLAVLAVALQVGGLDLLADELGVARRQQLLDEAEVLLLGSAGNCSRSICCSSTYIRCTGLAATSVLSKLKTLDRIL
jgi:hypothetical protein